MSRVDFITKVHTATKRDYVGRVNEADKAECAEVALKWGKDYWDGERRYGYGGYRYDGRWRPVAEAMAAHYKLAPGARILDVGCGKGFLLYELARLVPGAQVSGIDVSSYAIENAKEEVRPRLSVARAEKLPFPDKSFDLVYSVNTLHNLKNFELDAALREIERVSRGGRHVTVESYRDEREKVNLLYWQLTCRSFYMPDEWEWLFERMIRLLALWLSLAPARAAEIAPIPDLPWATGQILAISEMRVDPSTLLFEAATASRFGHMGIVAATPQGLMVYHSTPPGVQKTPLPEFLARARVDDKPDPQFVLLRHAEPLSANEQAALVAAMEDMTARRVPFNYTMVMNPETVNCSEFVRRAFEAVGRSGLGDAGPLGRSDFNAFDGALARLFRLRPPPPDATGVSPVSIVHSPQLTVVHAGLPVGRLLSEAEILAAWRSGGGLDALARATRVPRAELENLGRRAKRLPCRDYPAAWRPPECSAAEPRSAAPRPQ
jgi:protein-L-isoaspartate(D-aspartate) O-methyltransferase